VDVRTVSPDYFSALGIPILRGRSFREEDRTASEQTIILSASLARRLFRDQDPLGRIITFRPEHKPVCTVIGVAADVDNSGMPGRSDPEYYLLRRKIADEREGSGGSATAMRAARALHAYDGQACVIVRSAARPAAVASWIRQETAALDPTVPIEIATMRQRVSAMAERPRFNALLLTLFATIGVLLAGSGLYGLVSFLAVQRTQEIGVRMALGATPRVIARMVVTGALRWTAFGIAIGLAGAIFLARAMRTMLFGVSTDAVMISVAALLLFGVSVLAAVLPALRASRTDPIRALRYQ